ncbi:MAG: hypothetical protein KDI38_09160 [Calditrichaeota bacterium]|nr:hypothetical protein [Calditrichota bacterium]
MQIKRFISVIAILFLFPALYSALAQDKTAITAEWIYSDEGTAADDVPRFTWLANSTAILYDLRQPAAERSFELFDPGNGRRTPLLDMAAALSSLRHPRRAGQPGVVGLA